MDDLTKVTPKEQFEYYLDCLRNSRECNLHLPEAMIACRKAIKDGQLDDSVFETIIDALLDCWYEPVQWHYHARYMVDMILSSEAGRSNKEKLHRLYNKAYELNEGGTSAYSMFRNDLLLLLHEYKD